jgi:two-component system, cell cycle sensor histidine kinase and response regulator CckA
MSIPLRVLLIEDSDDDAALVVRSLRHGGYNPTYTRVETAEAMRDALTHHTWDLVVSDYSMPQFSGPAALQLLQAAGMDLPFIIVSGTIGEETAVTAMKAGAHDFLMKGNLTRLIPAVARELREAAERRERRRAEARFAGVLDATAEAIIAVDQKQRIVLFNASAERIFGYTAAEAHGQPLDILLPPALIEAHQQHIRTFAAPDASRRMSECLGEFVGRRKDGTEFPLEASIATLSQEGETIFTIFLQDISVRKQLEAQLFQSQKMEAIGQLAGGIAHDFNNLLTAITGYMELALDQLPPAQPIYNDVAEAQKAAMRAATLTRQLLAFARKQIIDPQVLDLNSLVLELDKLLRRVLGEHIELITHPASDLKPVKVDSGQIEQVIVNLAVNAHDAMPAGGKLTIKTSNMMLGSDYAYQPAGIVPGQYVMLTISDTGSGMDAEVQQHLFEPFFTTKEPGKGTGLGLATCYGIIKQHGGHIGVDSETGHGTTFKIYLPSVEYVEAPSDAVLALGKAKIVPKGTATLLVVEDEPLIRKLSCRVLRQQGYTVLDATNGEEALHAVHAYAGVPIDLLVTDVVMPRIGGKALAEQLIAVYPHIKVLFVSGYATDAIVHYGRLDPGTNFLAKPFTPTALAHKVQEVLDA